jgi:hypothetical protein
LKDDVNLSLASATVGGAQAAGGEAAVAIKWVSSRLVSRSLPADAGHHRHPCNCLGAADRARAGCQQGKGWLPLPGQQGGDVRQVQGRLRSSPSKLAAARAEYNTTYPAGPPVTLAEKAEVSTADGSRATHTFGRLHADGQLPAASPLRRGTGELPRPACIRATMCMSKPAAGLDGEPAVAEAGRAPLPQARSLHRTGRSYVLHRCRCLHLAAGPPQSTETPDRLPTSRCSVCGCEQLKRV